VSAQAYQKNKKTFLVNRAVRDSRWILSFASPPDPRRQTSGFGRLEWRIRVARFRCRGYVGGMSDAPSIHELSERVARMEERMETMKADYRSDLAELMQRIEQRNADMIQRIEQRNADGADRMALGADRIATATERMASNRWWQTAIMAAVAAVIGALAGGLPALVALIGG